MTVVQRLARRIVLGLLARLPSGQLTIVEGERRLVLGHGSPRATVQVRSPRLWPRLLHGSRGMAEAYMQGLWESPDLTAVVRVAARNASSLDRVASSRLRRRGSRCRPRGASAHATHARAAAATSRPTTTSGTSSSR